MMEKEKILIAVCGKGGTGKTAVSAMLSKAFIEDDTSGKILLIDADPALGLANAVGVHVEHTMGEIREQVIKTAGNKNEREQVMNSFDYQVFQTLHETDDFSFLAMGRTETLGCFCPVNKLLREAIEIFADNFNVIIVDGEAGVEQISRQVIRHVDRMLIVSDATERGIQTAKLVVKMIKEEKVIECDKLNLIFNRVQGEKEILEKYTEKIGIEVLGYIPQDSIVAEYDLKGQMLLELPDTSNAFVAVKEIKNKICKEQ